MIEVEVARTKGALALSTVKLVYKNGHVECARIYSQDVIFPCPNFLRIECAAGMIFYKDNGGFWQTQTFYGDTSQVLFLRRLLNLPRRFRLDLAATNTRKEETITTMYVPRDDCTGQRFPPLFVTRTTR